MPALAPWALSIWTQTLSRDDKPGLPFHSAGSKGSAPAEQLFMMNICHERLQGHNVAGECREAATLQMSRTEIETLLSELTRMHTSLTTCKEAAKWRHAAEFAVQLRTLLSRMLAWLVRQIGSAHLPYTMVSPCRDCLCLSFAAGSRLLICQCWLGVCARLGRPICPTSW